MYKVRVSYSSPRKFRVRYREEGAVDITIVTTLTGTFSMDLAGTGDVIIEWGDETTETVTLTAVPSTHTHIYADGGTITIRDASELNYITIDSMEVTRCDIRPTVTWIEAIAIVDNDLTYFHTYDTWVNLWGLVLYGNDLTSIETHPEWTGMLSFDVHNNVLTSVDVPEEWADIMVIDVSDNSLTSFTTYDTWVDLELLYVNDNSLTALETHAEWIALQDLYISNNALTTLEVHSEWVDLYEFRAQANHLDEAAVNHIMTELESVIAGASDDLWVDQDNNATPTGAGLTAANAILATGADVRWNSDTVTFDMTTITWDSTAVTWDNL